MLNKEQLEVVDNDDNILVIAGPGSGKTRVLVHKTAHILQNSGDSFKAVCLTFSNEASKHMKDELRKLLPAKQMHRLFVGNFHQYGQYLLRNYGHLAGISRKFTIMNPEQSLEILKESLEFNGLPTSNSQRLIDNISRYRNGVNLPKADDLGQFSSKFVSIMKSYESLKRERELVDFDDLIILPIDLLKQNVHLQSLVRQVYRYVLVDELQDTSLLQLELLKTIFDKNTGKILGVADQDQILYEWRDARAQTIKEFETAFDAKIKHLVLNYRSPQEILDVADTLIKHNLDRFDRKLVSKVKDRRGEVALHSAQYPENEADFVVNNIKDSISNGRRYGDHVVLFRDSWMAKDVTDTLSRESIPYVHIGDRRIANSAITSFLKASIYLASGSVDGERQLINSLRKLNENIDVDLGDGKELVQIISEIARFSPLRFVEALLGETGLRDSVRDSDFSKHLDIAVRVVEEALDEGAREYGQLSDVLSMEWERLEAKVLREEDSVKLMTIHKSKGLEFPVVYVIRVEEGNIPRIRKDSIPNIPEERRLLYVAITRSMEKVIMSHSKYKYNNNDRNFSSQSSFLDEISRCNLETI